MANEKITLVGLITILLMFLFQRSGIQITEQEMQTSIVGVINAIGWIASWLGFTKFTNRSLGGFKNK